MCPVIMHVLWGFDTIPHKNWNMMPITATYIPLSNQAYQNRNDLNHHFSWHCDIDLWPRPWKVNTLRPRQNGRLFADDSFKRIFLNENIRVSIIISMKFVPKGLINNIPAFVLIMAWRRPGDKPLSEPMMVRSLTHICVTRPQWVNQ